MEDGGKNRDQGGWEKKKKLLKPVQVEKEILLRVQDWNFHYWKQPSSLSFSAFKTSIKSCLGIVSLSIPLHSRLNSMSTFPATL